MVNVITNFLWMFKKGIANNLMGAFKIKILCNACTTLKLTDKWQLLMALFELFELLSTRWTVLGVI